MKVNVQNIIKIFFTETYENLHVTGFEAEPRGNRQSALTTKPYVLIKLRQNFYTLVTTYVVVIFYVV